MLDFENTSTEPLLPVPVLETSIVVLALPELPVTDTVAPNKLTLAAEAPPDVVRIPPPTVNAPPAMAVRGAVAPDPVVKSPETERLPPATRATGEKPSAS